MREIWSSKETNKVLNRGRRSLKVRGHVTRHCWLMREKRNMKRNRDDLGEKAEAEQKEKKAEQRQEEIDIPRNYRLMREERRGI